MNRITAAALVLCLGAAGRGWAAGHEHHHAKADAKQGAQTVTGEVLDMNCFMTHSGSGKKHAKCAKQCALEGSPMGILAANGDVYLLVEDHSKKKAFAAVKELAAEQVKVSGELRKRGGVQALVVDSIEKL